MADNPDFTDDDLRGALKDLGSFVDVTEEDLMKIYKLAIKHARQRVAGIVPVSRIMTKDVVCAKDVDDIGVAVRLLSENNISGLPVVDEDGRVIGVISEADILCTVGIDRGNILKDVLRRLLGEPLVCKRKGEKIRDIMSAPPITIRPDSGIGEAARIMTDKRIKRLPVVDDENRLIGIISRADIVSHARQH